MKTSKFFLTTLFAAATAIAPVALTSTAAFVASSVPANAATEIEDGTEKVYNNVNGTEFIVSSGNIATVERIEMGDINPDGEDFLTVDSDAKLVVSGGVNSSADNPYKNCSIVLGEWNAKTTLAVRGTLLAWDAIALVGDRGMDINISGGIMAVKGIGIAKIKNDKPQKIALNLDNGGTLVLGDKGIPTNVSKGWSSSLGDGTIGASANTVEIAVGLTFTNAAKGTTIDTSLYSFGADGKSLTHGTSASTITLSGELSGSGKLNVQGAGKLVLTGGGSLGSAEVAGGTLEIKKGLAVAGSLKTSGGKLVLETDFESEGGLEVAGGELSAGKTTVGSLDISGGKATFSSTLNAGKINLRGGDLSVTGATEAGQVYIDAPEGSFDFKGGLKVSGSLTVAGGDAVLGGSLEASEISVVGGKLGVSSLGAQGAFNFSVSGGELALNSATAGLDALFTVELSGGKISGLQLDKATEGTTLKLEGGELSGVSLSTGAIVLYADLLEGGSETGYLNGSAKITLSEGFSIESGTLIDLSNLVFEKVGDAYALFNVGSGITVDELIGALNATSDLGGQFSYDEDNNWVVFEAGEGMQFSLAWDAAVSNKYWRSDSFQGTSFANMEDRSVFFGRLTRGDEETVNIVSGAKANVVTISGGDEDVYKFVSGDGSADFTIGSLNVKRGTLDVRTAMTATKGILVSGGTLIGSVANALNVGDAGIDVTSGTLVLGIRGVTDAKTIELGAGATLELTANGALDSIENGGLVVSGTAEAPTTISWNGSTDSPTDKLKVTADSYLEFNVVSGLVELDASEYYESSANYVKTGAGTLELEAPTTLVGNISVTEGVLALDFGGTEGVFKGDVTVSGADSVLRLADHESFGTDRLDAVTVSVTDGARIEVSGDGNDDTQTMGNVTLVLGDNVRAGDIAGKAANKNGFKLKSSSLVQVEDNADAEIAVMVQLDNGATGKFNIGGGSTLTLSGGVADLLNQPDATASLEKSGEGTLIISANPSARNPNATVYSGATTIEGGALRFSGAATPGAGDISIASGASLEIASSGTTLFAGAVSGEGSIHVLSGKAEFRQDVTAALAIVDRGATLLLDGTYGTEEAPGALVLEGAIGGMGAFRGKVTLGEAAEVYAGAAESFNFYVTEFDGAKALAKTGAGTVTLESVLPTTFDLTLKAGALDSLEDQTVNSLVLDGGALAAAPGETVKWTASDLAVGPNGGSILTNLDLASLSGQTTLQLDGELVIGLGAVAATAEDVALSVGETGTLVISAGRNGALALATVVTDNDGAKEYFQGGSIVAGHLEVMSSLTSIRMATENEEALAGKMSEIRFNTGIFHGDIEILGQVATSRVVVGEEVIFGGYNDSTIDGVLASKDAAVATVNVTTRGASLTVGSFEGALEKVGEGTLTIQDLSGQNVSTIDVGEGALIIASLVDAESLDSVEVSNGGKLSLQGGGTLSGVKVTLSEGASFTGNWLGMTEGCEGSSLTDSSIRGSLSLSELGAGVTVGNMAVSGTVRLGGENALSGKIILSGLGTAITTERLEILAFNDKLSLADNFEVNYSLIGAEMKVVDFEELACYDETNNQLDLEDIGYNVNGYSHFSNLVDGKRTFYLVLDKSDSSLKIVADGTLLWNGATEWNTTDTGWETKHLTGNVEGETFSSGDYVDFVFSGSDNKIVVGETVAVTGVAFEGADEYSQFTVNFDNGAITDWTNEEGDVTKASVVIHSGSVQFTGTVSDSNEMFSGGLTLVSGAELVTDNTALLGRGEIKLGGTLMIDATESQEMAQALTVSGTHAEINVFNDDVSVAIKGALTGTHLTKSGDGQLKIAGDTDLGALTVAKGAVVVDHNGTGGEVGIDTFIVNSQADKLALTFAEGNSLDAEATIVLAGGKQVVFEGDSTWLNDVELQGANAEISVKSGEGFFDIGGAVESDDEAAALNVGMLAKSDAGVATLHGNLRLQGSGIAEGATAGLRVEVANEDGILKITGDVRDAENDERGKFAFEKLGAGTLAIGGAFETAGTVSVNAGSLSVAGKTELTGAVQILGETTLQLNSGGTLGNADVYVIVDKAATLSLKLGGDLNVAGNLSAAGAMTVDTGAGNTITFSGQQNVFTQIELKNNSTLKIAENATQFTGERITLNAGATLVVDGAKLVVDGAKLEDSSSGILAFTGSGTKLELYSATIYFDEISGNSGLSLEIDGDGEVISGGSVGSSNTMYLSSEKAKLTIDSEANTQLGKLKGVGTLTKKGDGKLTVSTNAKSSYDFAGNVVVEDGVVSISQGTLGQAVLTIGEDAEVVLTRSGNIGAWVLNQTVAGSLAGGEGTLAVEGEGSVLTFTKAIGAEFTGTLEARNGGTLVYNTATAGDARNVALSNAGSLNVAALSASETEPGLSMNTLSVSGAANKIALAEGRTLEIASVSAVDLKGTSNITFSGAGKATVTGAIVKAENSKAHFDIYTAADFTGTLTLSGENNAQRNTYVNSGTVVFSKKTSSMGTGEVVLTSSEKATVRFDDFADTAVLNTKISGAGTVEGNSGVLAGLSDKFVGTVRAIGAGKTFTLEKSGHDVLSVGTVVFEAEDGAELEIRTNGSDTVDTIEMGGATFGGESGAIELQLGTDQTLEVEGANSIAGELVVASGTVKVLNAGNLGTAKVYLVRDTILNVAADALFNKSISGHGTLVKNTSGMSYVDGTIDVVTTVSTGALAVSAFGENAEVTVRNGTLEFSKTLNDNNAIVNRASGDEKTFEADYVASGVVRFSHEASTARSIVAGGFSWENNVAGTVILVGGGEGSELNLAIKDGNVIKSGTGKWTLSDFVSSGSITLETGAGTLALADYEGLSGQNLTIGTDSVLEIASFRSYTDTAIRGTISGTGTLAVSADSGAVTLDLDAASETSWKLQVRNGANVKVSASGELMASGVEVQSNSEIRQSGGRLTLDTSAGDIDIDGRTFTIGGISKDANEVRNGLMVVDGGNTLDLTDSTLKLGGVLDIKKGTVEIETIGRITPTAGVVNIQHAGVLKIGAAGVEGEIAALSGTGKVVFVAGTTSLKNINMAQTPSEFNSEFTGTIEAQAGAVVVLDTGTTFGGASSVVLGAGSTLKVAQASETTLTKLKGAGTLEIANSATSVATAYGSDNDGFSGDIVVKSGRLAMTSAAFEKLANQVDLGTSASSGLMLRNTAAGVTELSTLVGKTNISGKGSIFLGSAFSIADNKAFGYGSGVRVDAGASLAMGTGAEVAGSLYVASGATLDVRSSVAGVRTTMAAGSVGESREVGGAFTLAGLLKAKVPTSEIALIHATGTATIEKSATIEVDSVMNVDDSFTLVSTDVKNGAIEKGATFRMLSGERLTARVAEDATKIVVSYDATGIFGVPAGLETLNKTILTNTDSDIYKAIYWSGTDAEQNAKLANFSPISFAGALELSTSLAQLENDLLRQRLEQRRYDRAIPEAEGTLKGFANILGSTSETDAGKSKSANYDLSHMGAVAGFDVSVTEDFLLGMTFSYDSGKADVHNGGGKHETDAVRVGVYGMTMLDEVSYFGFSAGLGVLGLDTSRRNELETLKGDSSGTDISLSTTLGRMFVIDAEAGLHVSPYVGLDYTFSRFGAFSEKDGQQSALDVDAMERHSLRGVLGATLNWLPTEDWRFTLEAAYRHEFMDSDADIDATFISGVYSGMNASSTAYFSGEDTISVGPRVECRLNSTWSVSAGYTFEADFDNTTTHSANVGVRCKF